MLGGVVPAEGSGARRLPQARAAAAAVAENRNDLLPIVSDLLSFIDSAPVVIAEQILFTSGSIGGNVSNMGYGLKVVILIAAVKGLFAGTATRGLPGGGSCCCGHMWRSCVPRRD
jgi:hypothetical protein